MFKDLKLIFKKICSLHNEILFYLVFILFSFYGVFDITTSRQTYHLSSNRLPSQVLLIALNACLLFGIVCLFFTSLRKKTFSFKNYFKLEHYFLYSSILGLIFCSLISVFLNKTEFKEFTTETIYFLTFLSLTLYFYMASKEIYLKGNKIKIFLLLIYFIYYFFLLFYYFYLQGRPTSNGSLRIPVLSHVFFPMSLIPSLRSYLKNKIFYIYLISIPLILITDKTSVFLVFFAYFLGDLFSSSFYKKHKTFFRVIVVIGILFFVGLVIVANTTPRSYLYSKLSFDAIIYQSGRLQNWTNIGSDFKNFSFLQWVFGKGTSATLLVNYGTAAHNDFLEYFYDYGILGLSCIVGFWLYFLIKLIREQKDRKNNWTLLFVYVSLFMAVSAIFSNANMLLALSISGFAFRDEELSMGFGGYISSQIKYGYYEINI